MMHSARLTKSDRLQRVAAFLLDGRHHTTMEIIQIAHVCAVNSIISELRANGMRISCQRTGDIWLYQFLGMVAA